MNTVEREREREIRNYERLKFSVCRSTVGKISREELVICFGATGKERRKKTKTIKRIRTRERERDVSKIVESVELCMQWRSIATVRQ